MITIVILPTVAVTLLATDNSRQAMEDEVINTNLSNIKWTGIYLDQQFDQLNSHIYSTLIHPDITAFLADSEEESLSEQYDNQRKISNLITNVFYSAGNYMVGVDLYVEDRKKLFRYNSYETSVNTLTESPELFDLLVAQKKDMILKPFADDSSKFRMIRSINRFENREKQGYISLDVRWSILDQTLELLNQGVEHPILLVSGDGKLLYQPTGEALPDHLWNRVVQLSGGPAYIETEDAFIFYNSNRLIDFTMIKVIPKSFVNQSAMKTMKYGLIVGLISVTLSIIIAGFLGWQISKPIVQLAHSMRGLNFMKKLEAPTSKRIDEIGLLEVKLHNMQTRIQEHILTEFQMELDKKNAELRALQAQINPHFIQNTMQMIGSMIYTNSAEESYHMIRSLSDMFRYVLREPDELATLDAELKHLKNYVSIQEQRFGKRLEIIIATDDRAGSIRLPKLTLQPIVENAFIHGLEKKQGKWRINLSIDHNDTMLKICIRDNGVGMNLDQLAQLRTRLQLNNHGIWTSGKHIGLVNIASRIQMTFGSNYGIKVSSTEHEGTEVVIIIPAERKERSL